MNDADRLRRWRLILGDEAEENMGVALNGRDRAMDKTLAALYDADRTGSLGDSSPDVARWLGRYSHLFSDIGGANYAARCAGAAQFTQDVV